MKHKQFNIQVKSRRKDGGRIVISTPEVDRDRDRVLPLGAQVEDYKRNPVVLLAHDYYSPFSIVGRTDQLDVSAQGIIADFTLRPAANEADPQNVVRLLWEQDFIRAASIGFMPIAAEPNELGGSDFTSWTLLEWSLVHVPANQSALALAAKSYPKAWVAYQQKRGRVLSAANEQRIRDARDRLDAAADLLSEVLSLLGVDEGDELAQLSAAIDRTLRTIKRANQQRPGRL